MTHQTDPELLDHVLHLLTDRGPDALTESIRLLINTAMRHERSVALQAKPYERTDTRKGCANGFLYGRKSQNSVSHRATPIDTEATEYCRFTRP